MVQGTWIVRAGTQTESLARHSDSSNFRTQAYRLAVRHEAFPETLAAHLPVQDVSLVVGVADFRGPGRRLANLHLENRTIA